jgi:hypothetical protein
MRISTSILMVSLGLGLAASCSSGSGTAPGSTGSGGSQAAGSGGSQGSTGGTAGPDASIGSGGSAGSDAATTSDVGGPDSVADTADAIDAAAAVDAINGTPDGGAYSRTNWTAVSVPPFPPRADSASMGQDLKYANAFDGDYTTRWSIGDTHRPIAQMMGVQFTFDMQEPHVFKKILFWSGGLNGGNGPDPRDYPGALEASVSLDCQTFGPALASGTEAKPGCQNGNTCNMPFVINMPAPATARCVRLTLTKVLQLGGGIWWGVSELFVYP